MDAKEKKQKDMCGYGGTDWSPSDFAEDIRTLALCKIAIALGETNR